MVLHCMSCKQQEVEEVVVWSLTIAENACQGKKGGC